MRKFCVFSLIIICIWSQALWAQGSSILAPVRTFMQYYGTADMDKVADVVNANFRDNKTKAEWIITTSRVLREIEYERLKGEITDKMINDNKGLVKANATIQTIVGKVDHVEVYYLLKENDRWLIDSLEITNENIRENDEKI